MLRITHDAVSLLERARSDQGVPEHFGVRVCAASRWNGQLPIMVDFRERPLFGDEVDERQGMVFFLAPEIIMAPRGLVLDVDGARGGVLVLREE